LQVARAASAAQLTIDPGATPPVTSPEAALFRADRLAAAGSVAEALRQLEAFVAPLEENPDALPADRATAGLARACFLELHLPERAPAAWKALGAQWPDNAQVQRAILNEAASVDDDRPLIA